MNKLVLTFVGYDNWHRPVYENDGSLYVDVDPRAGRKESICTKNNNDFNGEPDTPIEVMKRFNGVKLEFIPERKTW